MPDEFASAALRAVAIGYKALRFGPFGLEAARGELTREELHQAVRRAETVRAVVGPDIEVVVAMEGRFDPPAAVKATHALERIEPA
jgi:galactonate dehydratase